jgi:hypothetical protein
MFQITGMTLGFYKTLFWIAQVGVNRGINTPEQAALVFSGPRFFMALISGIVLAIAVQLVLTNLAVALGISVIGQGSGSHSQSDSQTEEAGSLGGTISKIGTLVGLGTLISVSVALFIACFLAVKLSLLTSAGLGAIVGLVIWAAYFSLLIYVSSTTVGSLVGSVVNTASSGLQAIAGTAAAALGARAASNQVVSTAEAAAAAVSRQITSAIDPTSIRDTLEDYLGELRPPELDLSRIRSEFEKLLSDPQLREIAGSGDLRNIDRQKFVDLVSSRTDLSKRDINRIVDQLETVWRQTVDKIQPTSDRIGELVDYIKKIQPGQADVSELNAKLDRLIEENRQLRQASQQQPQDSPGPVRQAIQSGLEPLLATVLGRADLSDLDVQKILGALSTARGKVTEQADKLASQTGMKSAAVPYSTIRADVENYLLNTFSGR